MCALRAQKQRERWHRRETGEAVCRVLCVCGGVYVCACMCICAMSVGCLVYCMLGFVLCVYVLYMLCVMFDVYMHIYKDICLWVSLWSTFFQKTGQSLVHMFFSEIRAASSMTISSPCSRYKPIKKNSGAGQSVVHPLVSLWSTFFTTYPSKMWTRHWPGGGPETDLQFYENRPPKHMVFSTWKHYKKRGFGTPTDWRTRKCTKFSHETRQADRKKIEGRVQGGPLTDLPLFFPF